MICACSTKALALSIFLLLFCGCISILWVDSIENLALILEAPYEAAYPGEDLPVSIELRNEGDSDIVLCLGEPVFHLMGNGKVKSNPILIADHHFCSKKLTIRANESKLLEEDVPILLEDPGPASIYLTIEIVNPGNCDHRYGCEHILLHGQTKIQISQR